jgi:hypothetical protein
LAPVSSRIFFSFFFFKKNFLETSWCFFPQKQKKEKKNKRKKKEKGTKRKKKEKGTKRKKIKKKEQDASEETTSARGESAKRFDGLFGFR